MDVETGKIDLEEFRNGFDRAVQIDLVQHDVQHAAALQARAVAMVLEMHRDGDRHARARLEPEEIDMHRAVGHGIDLDMARDDAGLLAVELKHEQAREHAAGAVHLHKAALVELHVLRVALAAIDDAGDHPLLAGAIGCALARFGARLGAQVLHLTHGGIP